LGYRGPGPAGRHKLIVPDRLAPGLRSWRAERAGWQEARAQESRRPGAGRRERGPAPRERRPV